MIEKSSYFLDGDDLIERRTYDSEPFLEHAKALRAIG